MPTSPPARGARRSTFVLLLSWLAIGAVLWAGFDWYQARERAQLIPYVEADGALVIPRSPDGHFYTAGEVNHAPVRFLVDTGASSVAITDATARAAHLPAGEAIVVGTAAGPRDARRIHDVPVAAGPLARNDVTVTTGLQMDAHDALLGQSFLRHYDVAIDGQRMTLRPRDRR